MATMVEQATPRKEEQTPREFLDLSQHTKVRVRNCSIEFNVVPEDQRLKVTEVTLSKPAWMALGNKRDMINTYLQGNKPILYSYYNSKHFEVKTYGGDKWNVDLLTIGRRGGIRWSYSVSLTEAEWKKLTEVWHLLDDDLQADMKGGTVPMGKCRGYTWMVCGKDGSVMAEDDVPYYCEAHAKDMANQQGHASEGTVRIRGWWIDSPCKAQLVQDLRVRALKAGVRQVATDLCRACEAGVDSDLHKTPGGCADPDADFVTLYLKDAYQNLDDETMMSLFAYAWKEMGQNHSEVKDLITALRVNDDLENLKELTRNTDLNKKDPLTLLFNDAYLHVFGHAVMQ